MFDTSEYYGGTYPSPCEDDEEREEDFDYGDYIDYVYDRYRDEMMMREMEENNND